MDTPLMPNIFYQIKFCTQCKHRIHHGICQEMEYIVDHRQGTEAFAYYTPCSCNEHKRPPIP
jgi:hypothetical protein